MAYEQKEMSGSLFKNNERRNENDPTAKGTALIDGVAYWVSGWTKKDKNGNPWQSLSFKKKEPKVAAAPTKKILDFDADDLPF